jgi:DNA-binding transcriptional LysR family regulator
MYKMHIASIDLNLLRVFDALYEERSVTRVGARLGLSQSAVSHALNRLRAILEDELFVRGAKGMSPTPRARELGPRVHLALRQIQDALMPSAFDPAVSERRFVIVASAYASAMLLPTLMARMADVAPKAGLMVIDGSSDLLEQMETQRADFVIGPVAAAPSRVACDQFMEESLAWVVGVDHPLTRREVRIEDLAETPHVVIARPQTVAGEGATDAAALVMRSSWENYGDLQTQFQALGLRRRIGLVVPDTYPALSVVSRSDMTALIPRRLASICEQQGILKIIEPPLVTPRVSVSLLYLRERLSDPAMRWMRDLLREVAVII